MGFLMLTFSVLWLYLKVTDELNKTEDKDKSLLSSNTLYRPIPKLYFIAILTFCKIEEFDNKWNQAIKGSLMLHQANSYTVHTHKLLAIIMPLAVVI